MDTNFVRRLDFVGYRTASDCIAVVRMKTENMEIEEDMAFDRWVEFDHMATDRMAFEDTAVVDMIVARTAAEYRAN